MGICNIMLSSLMFSKQEFRSACMGQACKDKLLQNLNAKLKARPEYAIIMQNDPRVEVSTPFWPLTDTNVRRRKTGGLTMKLGMYNWGRRRNVVWWLSFSRKNPFSQPLTFPTSTASRWRIGGHVGRRFRDLRYGLEVHQHSDHSLRIVVNLCKGRNTCCRWIHHRSGDINGLIHLDIFNASHKHPESKTFQGNMHIPVNLYLCDKTWTQVLM